MQSEPAIAALVVEPLPKRATVADVQSLPCIEYTGKPARAAAADKGTVGIIRCAKSRVPTCQGLSAFGAWVQTMFSI